MKAKPDHIKKDDWNAVGSPEIGDELLNRMKPVEQEHPQIPKRVRGPQKQPIKTPVAIRLNSEVVDYFKSQGKGWQSKINDVLNEYIKKNK